VAFYLHVLSPLTVSLYISYHGFLQRLAICGSTIRIPHHHFPWAPGRFLQPGATNRLSLHGDLLLGAISFARFEHFWLTVGYALYFLRSHRQSRGRWNKLRSMITGRTGRGGESIRD